MAIFLKRDHRPASLRACMIGAWLLMLALLGACGEIKVRAGSRVDPLLLETSLRVGQSREGDVRQVLGEPLSIGREFLPMYSRPRTVWSYYFEEGQVSLGGGGDSRRISVLVFMADGVYDGYLWYSSLPEHRTVP